MQRTSEPTCGERVIYHHGNSYQEPKNTELGSAGSSQGWRLPLCSWLPPHPGPCCCHIGHWVASIVPSYVCLKGTATHFCAEAYPATVAPHASQILDLQASWLSCFLKKAIHFQSPGDVHITRYSFGPEEHLSQCLILEVRVCSQSSAHHFSLLGLFPFTIIISSLAYLWPAS